MLSKAFPNSDGNRFLELTRLKMGGFGTFKALFVTAATKDSQHRKDGEVQTFTFGRDEIVPRVYNKSDEIKEASGKYWFYLFWQEQTENVWRVEWQVRIGKLAWPKTEIRLQPIAEALARRLAGDFLLLF